MSRRAKHPLNNSACQAADEQLYRRHRTDPLPNALYSEGGQRKALDPSDPAQEGLRSEWLDLYQANGGEVVDDKEEEPETGGVNPMANSTGSAVQPCVYKWIRFRVVEDASDSPIPGVKLLATWPDQRITKHDTDQEGMVNITQCVPGSYKVASNFEGMILHDTLGFAAQGDTPTGVGAATGGASGGAASDLAASPGKPTPLPSRARCIAKIEERKVKSDDQLESIASESGMTWRQLAHFNWGTKLPRRINRYLRDYVGCTKKTRDRANYIFSDQDDPGLLYVPKAWSLDGLAVEKTHTIRCNRFELFPIILENDRDLRLPEVKFKAKFSDGSSKEGILTKSGVSLVKNPPEGEVLVSYPELPDAAIKSLAASARRAFDTRNEDEIYRVLQHSSQDMQKVEQAYQTYFNDLHGQGLAEDIYKEFVQPELLLAAEGLMARAGMVTHGGVRYVVRDMGDNLAQDVDILQENEQWPSQTNYNESYIIVAAPSFRTVTPGAEMKFSCNYVGPTYISGNDSPREKFQWFAYNDPEKALRLRKSLVVVGPAKPEWELKAVYRGRHTIACCVIDTQGRKVFYEYPQWVETRDAVLGTLFDRTLKNEKQPNPFVAVNVTERTIVTLEAMAKDPEQKKAFEDKSIPLSPGSHHNMDVVTGIEVMAKGEQLKSRGELLREKHDKKIKELKRFGSELNAMLLRLASTVVHPIFAAHLAETSQTRTQLRVFVVRIGLDNGREKWRLVDWTNPMDNRLRGEIDGSGASAEEAIKDALAGWGSSYDLFNRGNRYWPGCMQYQVPESVCGVVIRGEFQTTGKKFWDNITEMLSYIALGLAIIGGVITLLAPVPGSQLASAAIWSFVFSSLAAGSAAAINYGQRRDEHINDWKADAMDGLTIVGSIFGLGVLRYARNAMVAVQTARSAKTAQFLLIGTISTDMITGVLLAEEHVKDYDDIMGNMTLTPDERLMRLLRLFASAAKDVALIAISIRASHADIENIQKGLVDKKNLKLLQEKNGKVTIPPQEEVKPVKGKTKDGEHLTRLQQEQPRAVKPARKPITKWEDLDPNSDIWRYPPHRDEGSIRIQRKCPDPDNPGGVHPLYGNDERYDVWFNASFEKGVVHVDYIQVKTKRKVPTAKNPKGEYLYSPELKADELYRLMFDWFESVAQKTGKPIKGFYGDFAFENYDQIYKAVQKDSSLVLDTLPSGQMELKPEALQSAKTWKYWQEWLDSKGYQIDPVFKPILNPKVDPSDIYDPVFVEYRFKIVR